MLEKTAKYLQNMQDMQNMQNMQNSKYKKYQGDQTASRMRKTECSGLHISNIRNNIFVKKKQKPIREALGSIRILCFELYWVMLRNSPWSQFIIMWYDGVYL